MIDTEEKPVAQKLYAVLVEGRDDEGQMYGCWSIVGENLVNDPYGLTEDLPYIVADLAHQMTQYVPDSSRWSWRAAETPEGIEFFDDPDYPWIS